MHAYRAIIAVTMAVAPVITSGLTALSLVVGAIHLIFGRHPPRIAEVEGGSRRVAGIAGALSPDREPEALPTVPA